MPEPDERPPSEQRVDLLGILLVLVVLAAGLRLVDLDRNPPELFEDELSGAASAWSIATTGHDLEKTVLPFLVTRLELKQPLYFAATVPFQAALGQTTLAVRLPAVVFGTITTLLVVALVVLLGYGLVAAIAGGLLFAVTPWAIHYARAGWEPAAFLPFVLGGVILLWAGLRDHRRPLVVIAAIVLAVGAYAYHPALLMDVVMAGLVVLLRARQLTRRDVGSLAIGAAPAALILVPYLLAFQEPLFFERTRNISVFRDGLSLDALLTAWQNYWAQWDPGFLFGGAAPNPRINPGVLVFPWLVPFFVLGLDRLVHRRRLEDVLLLAWLVVGPLPAAITQDGTSPHAARGLVALPAIVAISAIGVARAIELLGRLPRPAAARAAAGALVLGVVVGTLVLYQDDYHGSYRVRSASWWGYGSGAALALAADQVPPDGTVCIATNDISGFTFPHHVAWHLHGHAFRVVENVRNAVCRKPGTYVLSFASRELHVPVRELGIVPDIRGAPMFHLVVVDPGAH